MARELLGHYPNGREEHCYLGMQLTVQLRVNDLCVPEGHRKAPDIGTKQERQSEGREPALFMSCEKM